MTPTPFNVGAFVAGAPTSLRALVRHADLLTAYAAAARRCVAWWTAATPTPAGS